MSNDPYRKSYELIEAEVLAVPESALLRLNVDAASAVLTVVGALPSLLTLRPAFERELPRFPLDKLDKLEAYAKGLGYAHALYLTANGPSRTVTELAARAEQVCAQLDEAARALAGRSLLDPAQYARVATQPAGKRSYKTLVFQLIGYVDLFRKGAARVEGKTPVIEAELADAERLAADFGDALGLREHGDAEDSDANESALNRRRAYTLFWSAYDQVRRAVTYLRWDTQDAERFAPSLYAGRTSAGVGTDVAETPPGAAPSAASGAATSASTTPPSATSPSTAGTAADSGGSAAAPTPASPVRPGFPGGDPFEPAAPGAP